MNIDTINECPECASLNIVKGQDKIVCKDCALLFEPLATPTETKTTKKTQKKKKSKK